MHDAWDSLLIQTRNQLILRLAEITVTSEWTGEKTAVSILERFPLTLPGAKKPPGVRRASTVQPSHRAGTPSLMNRPNAANSMFASPIDDMQVRQLEKFTDWARTAIKSQQNDMNQIGAAIDRMERDMKSFRDFMQEIRTELTTYHQFQESMKEKELPVLREDLKGLRIEVDANRQFRNTLTEEEFPVLQEDIDALRSELAKTQQFQQQLKHHDLRILGQNLQGLRLSLGELTDQKEDKLKLCHDEFDTLMDEVRELNRKANEIDGVRAELEYFKARIASLESSQETLKLKKAENPRVELASEPKSGTIPGREDKVPLAESLQPSKHTQQSRYEWSEKRDQSLPKRWNFHSENNDEVSYEPPTKRLRRSAGRVSTRYLSVPFQTPESPIVVSSNHGTPSPILDRHGLRNEGGELSGLSGSCVQFKDQEDNIHSVPQLTDSPPQTNQKHLGKRQPLSRSTMPPVLKYPNSGLSQEALERPCGISASSISAVTAYRRRASNSSLQNNLISDPLDEKLSGDNIPVSSSSGRLDGRRFRRKARYSNVINDNLIMDFRPQDCSGALLNSGETSGERSYQLRRRVSSKGIDKPKYARQRSETPDQLSIIIADEAMQKSVPRRASDGAKVRGSNLFGRSVRAPKGNIGKRSSGFKDISEAPYYPAQLMHISRF
jgi:hypothetical protein